MTRFVPQVFWYVTLCHWVRSSWCFEGSAGLQNSGNPKTRHSISDDLNLQQHSYCNLISCKITLLFEICIYDKFPTLIVPITRTISGKLFASETFEHTMILNTQSLTKYATVVDCSLKYYILCSAITKAIVLIMLYESKNVNVVNSFRCIIVTVCYFYCKYCITRCI